MSGTTDKSMEQFRRLDREARDAGRPRPNVFHYFADRYSPTFLPPESDLVTPKSIYNLTAANIQRLHATLLRVGPGHFNIVDHSEDHL